MAGEEEKLLIDEEEIVQIKDLNKVTTVNNNDLLLLDDGVASSNAITYENFLKTTKDKTFKGEGLGYFKEIIKSTIAEELAADEEFVEKIYEKVIDKLIGNNSNKLSSLFSKIKSRLTDSISSATLSRYDDLLIMSSSSIQKTPVPKQLLGVPSDFSFGGRVAGSTIYWTSYEQKRIVIDMESYNDVNLIFHKSYDDQIIYLDIELEIKHHYNETRKLYLKYSDESETNLVYRHKSYSDIDSRFPIYKGWYMQKRSYLSGSQVPYLMKL
ncbi:conserved hypothetical protein (plasmid) [Borreliella afzelii PKo]|uniref:Uncharacterized protein n=4 Tax=Borreliella afzelii TaxID=29518 RepID=G0ISL5_BORAP|nr:conserved hypothetical protein [Borreliella afzelii PKo]MBB5141813.1 hypothetical protein [Borreliella afzelii]